MPDLPPTRTDDVTDEYFGEIVADPYRWLEEETDAEVGAWAGGRDEHCRAALAAFPGRAAIESRLVELAQIGRVGMPQIRGGRLFFQQRTGLQDQPVLMMRESLDADARVLLDPNAWAADATVALDWWHPSEDGSWLAYGTSEGGTEISTLKVLRTDRATGGADAPPIAIERCRAADIGWLPDHGGFYYTRYPRPGEVPADEATYHRHVFFHAMDAAHDGSDDIRVFGEGQAKERWSQCVLSPDGRWLLVTVIEGWSRSDLWLVDGHDRAAGARVLVEGRDALYMGVAGDDGLYVVTNEDAPRYRLLRADWSAPARDDWTELIPEGEGTLEAGVLAAGRIVVRELRDATHRLRVFTRGGELERELALPTLGTVGGFDVEPEGTELVFDFQSFTVPPALFHVDLSGGADPALLHSVAESAPDPERFQVRQVRYASSDGTDIPMFLASQAGATADASRKCLLYGYGGFNVSLTPMFSAGILAWIERGGVYALANLRGGGEFGEDWHRAGMLKNKQNVFDDFAAAGDWLVAERWCTRDRLAVQGGSNGGLLSFATITQRPDLCRAAIAAVPLADMLRYHLFQIARLWIPEYGSAEDEAMYRVLRAYSPYHNVQADTDYPAMLVMTGESDTRVDPLHARKMAAALEAASASGHPVLLRVERKAGHGQGMPLTKAIEGLVDQHCFLEWQLGE